MTKECKKTQLDVHKPKDTPIRKEQKRSKGISNHDKHEEIWNAAIKGDWKTVEYILKRNPMLISVTDKVNFDGFNLPELPSLYLTALRSSDVKFFLCLVDLVGFVDDISNWEGNDWPTTLLHYAAQSNTRVSVLKYFISQGANPNTRDYFGATLLSKVAQFNKVEVLKYILSQGISINTRDCHGGTLLHDAARFNPSVDVLKYLVASGIDVNSQDNNGNTPLYEAAGYTENMDVLRYLVSQGANVNTTNYDGDTPLHWAAENSAANEHTSEQILRTLISIGAEINAQNNVGATPLHAAAREGSDKAVEYLVLQGANVNACEKDGKTPRDFADSDEKMSLLYKAGGRLGKNIYFTEEYVSM